ncbi:RTA1-domain-containing protein [Dendrothele bispora CBS 962.96]|uniref:RTA1-domain-containing protein n=1 Tax=Dendrothele bispora (strain CBS 962.96) TaxID=1314807 RepID=A0A4S8KP95_DENBC|nr:RTA1-domain-containing protein [Dendrothele bispora CBS 962.96]
MVPNNSKLLSICLFLLFAALGGVDAQSNSTSDNTPGFVDGKRVVAGFIPRNWASGLALGLYAISVMFQWLHWFRTGRKKYMLVLTIGMTCMETGFGFRILYSLYPSSLGLYVLTTMFTLLSPCAFLATDYILLERLAENLGHDVAKSCLFLSSSLIVKIFVAADILTFLIQAGGGGLQASADVNMADIGSKVAIVGLVLQLVSFGLFTCLLLVFGFRVRTSYPERWRVDRHGQTVWSTIGLFKTTDVYDWRILFTIIALSCICIIIRCAFRIFEYAGGYYGNLATHEIYFYLLDALPLWIAMTQYSFFWPVRFKPYEPMEKRGEDVSLDSVRTAGRV